MQQEINLLDLFSGIGGFHKGLEQAGFKIGWNGFSDIDKYANAVYQYQNKDAISLGSVTDIQGKNLPRVDAITFGSPCQDFSIAGRRSGLEGDRSSLISEAIRLIDECQPRFFIWENVKGTFSSNNRQDFAAILQAFANIGDYRIEWQLLNTKWFLPQNRERVYLVGYAPGKSRGQVFPIGESFRRDVIEKESSSCITTSYHKGVNFDNQLIKTNTKNGNTNTLSSVQKDNYVIGDYRTDEGYRERFDNNSPCLTSSHNSENALSSMPPLVNKIRRLTPIECERLQGFPDNWTQEGVNGPISDTQRYKMCGNAVTVDVVEAVGKQILKL